MTIVGTTEYVNGDISKLAKNSYAKRDPDFSGLLYYSTPQGKFLGGYIYSHGNITNRLTKSISSSVGSKTVQSTGKQINTAQMCTSWYYYTQYTNSDGTLSTPEYHYGGQDCYDVPFDTGVPGIPTTGGGGSGGSGGGGSSNPGGVTPTEPNPCKVEGPVTVSGTKVSNSLQRQKLPDDGGFPPAPEEPCPQVQTIIIVNDPSVTNDPKLNCIITKLGLSNPAVSKFLAEFMTSTKYNITYKMDEFSGTANAYTEYTNNNPNVTIHIRKSYVNGVSTAAEVARTMIHEMAHAYLAQKIITVGGPDNLKQNLDNDYQTLFNNFTKYVDPVTGNYKITANNNAQHDFMAEKLIGDIAVGLKDFVELNTPATKMDQLVTTENYRALAWQTLRGTEAYQLFKSTTGETDETQNSKISLLNSSTSNGCN